MRDQENRKHARMKCRVIVDSVGSTIDMSAGGLRVLMANPLAIGSEVALSFQLPESEEQVQCHGRVAHVSRSRVDRDLREVGIQFLRMLSRHREALDRYTAERTEECLLLTEAREAGDDL